VIWALIASSVRLTLETLSSTDVTNTGEKSLSNIDFCTIGSIIQANQRPIIDIFATKEVIKKTLDNTTKFSIMDNRLLLCKNFRRHIPAVNISRVNATFVIDSFFGVPELDHGIMDNKGTAMIKLYCECDSQLTAIYLIEN
jgi:hypothetical protein